MHGMPSREDGALKSGDIVSIDTGVELNGYFGDSAVTCRSASRRAQAIVEAARSQESLELAIDKMRPGNRLFDVCGDGGAACGFERVFSRP